MKFTLFLAAAFSVLRAAASDASLVGAWDFKESLKGWGCDGRAERVETAPMSGVWVLRATGPVKVVLNRKISDWEADEEYTLVVRMRSVGEGSKLLAIQRNIMPGGGIGEGTYIANMAVDGEWHEYFLPFRTAKGRKPCAITFLKVDTGAPGTGMEVEWMRLHRGKISSFEIRRIGRPGRQTPTPGTEIPIPANRFGAAAKKIRALALVDSVVNLREALRVFEGTGAKVDVVCTTGKDQDVYTTDSDPEEVMKNLKNGGVYDVYLIGRRTAPRIGGEMAKYVLDDVRGGAGLYFGENREPGHFAAAVGEVKEGRLGKGRADIREPSRLCDRPPNYFRKFVTLDPDHLADEGLDFPYEDIAFAVSADAVWQVARGEPPKPDASRRRKIVDIYGGERHTLVWDCDRNGRTVAFRHSVEPIRGPRLGAFCDDGSSASVKIEDRSAGVKVVWKFSDFSGRVFAQGEGTGDEVAFELPREKLYTNLGVLKMRLVKDGKTLDRRTEAVYVKGNDVKRLMDDFGVSMWPMSAPIPFRDAMAMFRSLEKVGFTATFMPMGGLDAYGVAYGSGMAVAGPYVVGGEYFSGSPKAKNNVRYPVFNSAQARKDIEALAERRAKRMSRYGVYHTAFSDEATLGPPDQEVDAHPENVAEYRRRMEKKYGTIAEYNRRHLTAHASFSDLGPVYVKDARAAGNAAEFVEWRNFNVDRWVEVIKLVVDTSKRINPDVKVSLDNSFGETAFGGNDYWKLLTRTGLDYSKEYTSMVHFGREPFNVFDEYYRSFRPDMRVWGWTGYAFTRPRERFLPWWTAAHRYGGFTWFAATYWGINLIDLPSGAITLDALELGESLRDSRMLKGLGKTLTLWPWIKNDVALYYSHDSAIVSTFLGKETKDKEMLKGGPFHDFSHSRLGAQFLVEDLLYQHDFVAPEQVVGGKLVKDGYRILFMPRIVAMSDAEVAAVKAFAAAGGKVVADVMPGDCDELGVRRGTNPFTAAEIETIGKNFSDLDSAQREWALKTLRDCKATSALVSPTIVSSFGREAMHYSSGDADLYVVLRMPGRSSDEAEETFIFGKTGYVYDVRVRKLLGRADRVRTKVPLNEAAAFAVLKERVDAVAVRGTPAEAERGGVLKLDFEILSKDVSPRFMLHVEIVPPGEKEARFHFRRNLETAGGKASLEFPLALNDPAGRWKIRVTEPLTGISADGSFVLK
jgi:hypothetical protein